MSHNGVSPFCQVCFDTGKPESLYTNHFITDVPGKDGVVICPTLLSLGKEKKEKKDPALCMSCGSSPIDARFTKEILSETCTFCSGWCQRDYEYDARKGRRASFYCGLTRNVCNDNK
jgi:hypothetical protein